MAIPGETRAELKWQAADFRVLACSARPLELIRSTNGTRWNNRELLFHMWFGQRIARTVIPVVGALSRLPTGAARQPSRMLTAATKPYEWVNFEVSMAGGRLVGLQRLCRWMDRDTGWLLRWADQATVDGLARGIAMPAEWDPYFMPWMSCGDLLRWAPQHYRHHRAQLTLDDREV